MNVPTQLFHDYFINHGNGSRHETTSLSWKVKCQILIDLRGGLRADLCMNGGTWGPFLLADNKWVTGVITPTYRESC